MDENTPITNDTNEQERIPLSRDEIQKLRIKIGKNHRNAKDWQQIKDILSERVVYTAVPTDPEMKREYSLHGVILDGDAMLVFSTMETCTDYLEKFGVARFGFKLSIGTIPYLTAEQIASDYGKRLYLDYNAPENSKVLGVDGQTQTIQVFSIA